MQWDSLHIRRVRNKWLNDIFNLFTSFTFEFRSFYIYNMRIILIKTPLIVDFYYVIIIYIGTVITIIFFGHRNELKSTKKKWALH